MMFFLMFYKFFYMKKFIKFSATALTAAVMALHLSCKDEENPILSVSPHETDIVFAADGVNATSNDKVISRTFTVQTNQSEWEIASNQTWVRAFKSGNMFFTLTADANVLATAPADAEITITAGNAIPVTIGVKQLPAAPKIMITPWVSSITFSADGETAFSEDGKTITPTFTLTSNMPTLPSWNVAKNQSWLEWSKEGNDTFKLTATPHTNMVSPDEAKVTITIDGFDDIVITANQSYVIVLNVTETDISVDETDDEFSLEVTSNVDYVFELPHWIQVKDEQPSGAGKTTWTFTPARMAPGERSGTIVVVSEPAALGYRVEVPVFQKINVTKIGSWLFEDPTDLTKATIGKDLIHQQRNIPTNPAPNAWFGVQAGDPPSAISSVDGPSESNKAVRLPVHNWFLAEHGMIPKEGETFISEYTIFFEFKVPIQSASSPQTYYPFFKTRITQPGQSGGSVDAEVLLRGSDRAIGIGATGYGGSVTDGQWYRLYLTYKPGDIKYYLNGVRIISSTSADARFRINLNGVFFSTSSAEKTEYTVWDIAEISMWNGALTEQQVLDLEK